MRNLVRQTVEKLRSCFRRLSERRAFVDVPVYQLMGGAIDDAWEYQPDKPWILVGTQDQLLSRALNRGYGMSRFKWPVHFGLLNHDCHWIVDEVQLMGPGLWTTSQLDWMRRKRFRSLKPCRTTWMSATLGLGFLATSDRVRDGLDRVAPFDPKLKHDATDTLLQRLSARRPLKWFVPGKGKKADSFVEELARGAHASHIRGTLTLIICNTVDTAQIVFRSLPDEIPKLLLTSRFRPNDRREAEERLSEFEARRAATPDGIIADDSGLICVSTQVVEAGLDISSHRLWTELAPWGSLIQRLGRLNRDGRANAQAQALLWEPGKEQERKIGGETFTGPYARSAIQDSKKLVNAIEGDSCRVSFTDALDILKRQQSGLLYKVLQPVPFPYPRALDVHGLFSTEPDVHGGFTDVSPFVRDADPDADLTVFWREWQGSAPPRGDELDGPAFDPGEGCAVPFYRLREVLERQRERAWAWDDQDAAWKPVSAREVRAGMLLMLSRRVGCYDHQLGWTGRVTEGIRHVPRAGRLRSLKEDERTEIGYWTALEHHLEDARAEARSICDGVLPSSNASLQPYRAAVIEAAALHDIGKAHPKWQRALPAENSAVGELLAKCPYVAGIDIAHASASVERSISCSFAEIRPASVRLPDEGRTRGIRLRWVVDEKLTQSDLAVLRGLNGVRWAGHVAFRPEMRHEAASALAMWHRYRQKQAAYPALAVYLAAAHHGKVRTVLRSTSGNGGDVFGIQREPGSIHTDGVTWPLDFSLAADGAEGDWLGNRFVLRDFGWTGIVADILGPWEGRMVCALVGAVPDSEPHALGPFLLAWLEGLVRTADVRASKNPSHGVTPSQIVAESIEAFA